MKTQRHAARARVAAAGVVAGVLLAGCGAANESAPAGGSAPSAGGTALSGTISGAGASSQQAAMQAWIAGFTGANPDATVNYDPAGSGAGRTQFLVRRRGLRRQRRLPQGGRAHQGAAALRGRRRRGSGLRLADRRGLQPAGRHRPAARRPATTAGIFSGKITNWNAPEIAADNPGKTLPDQAITPVHRSDESGTTQNFTDYLNKASGGAWTEAASGTWPIQGGEAAQGTSGVIGAVQGGNGTIGYADESQAGSLGKALIKVGDAFTGPTPEAAANVLAESKRVEGRGNSSFAFDLARDTTAAGTYPIVLVSYQIACSKYADAAQADLVKGFLTYTTSADGQQAAAQAAGSAPLSDELRTQITPAVTGITAGA